MKHIQKNLLKWCKIALLMPIWCLALVIYAGYWIYTFFQVIPKDQHQYSMTLSDGREFKNVYLKEIRWNRIYFDYFHADGIVEAMSIPVSMFLCGFGGIYMITNGEIVGPDENYVSSKGWIDLDE